MTDLSNVMTNVRTLRSAFGCDSTDGISVGRAVEPGRVASLRAGRWPGLLLATLMIGLVAGADSVCAQGPSGVASETININRDGVGFSVRGGHVAAHILQF